MLLSFWKYLDSPLFHSGRENREGKERTITSENYNLLTILEDTGQKTKSNTQMQFYHFLCCQFSTQSALHDLTIYPCNLKFSPNTWTWLEIAISLFLTVISFFLTFTFFFQNCQSFASKTWWLFFTIFSLLSSLSPRP